MELTQVPGGGQLHAAVVLGRDAELGTQGRWTGCRLVSLGPWSH